MKKQTVSLLIFAIAALAAGAFCIGYSSREETPPALVLMEVPSLQESDIASIRFSRQLGRNQVWETDDAEIIAEVYLFLETVSFTEDPGVIGGWLWFELFFHTPVDGVESIKFGLPGINILSVQNTDQQYLVTSGGYREAQWDSILERCTLIFDSAQ